jgi:fructose-bisphosphate aldolase class II
MQMQSLRDTLSWAQSSAVAVGHFNVSDFTLLKAVFSAARDLKLPVVIGASEGERHFLERDSSRRSSGASERNSITRFS